MYVWPRYAPNSAVNTLWHIHGNGQQLLEIYQFEASDPHLPQKRITPLFGPDIACPLGCQKGRPSPDQAGLMLKENPSHLLAVMAAKSYLAWVALTSAPISLHIAAVSSLIPALSLGSNQTPLIHSHLQRCQKDPSQTPIRPGLRALPGSQWLPHFPVTWLPPTTLVYLHLYMLPSAISSIHQTPVEASASYAPAILCLELPVQSWSAG